MCVCELACVPELVGANKVRLFHHGCVVLLLQTEVAATREPTIETGGEVPKTGLREVRKPDEKTRKRKKNKKKIPQYILSALSSKACLSVALSLCNRKGKKEKEERGMKE